MNIFKSLLLALALSLAVALPGVAAERVDINTASAVEIADALNGIGLAKAEAIVAYRSEHGPFKSAEQLAEVKGIGLKTVDKNRDRIQLGGGKPVAQAGH